MKTRLVALAFLLSVAPALGQRYSVTINTLTPDGQVLQQIGQEADVVKKLALMEQFTTQYPKHEAIPWIYSQMVPDYTKANQHAKALEIGEKLLAMYPDDARTAHDCLKAAEAAKDPDLVMKWSTRASGIARKVAQSSKPTDEDEVETWEQQVDFAKQLDTYTEYSLYAAALQATDPAKKIALSEALQKQNPESEYVEQIQGQYFVALQQAGQTEKAVGVAEKVLEKDPNNEDMLLAVADYYLKQNKEPDKVLSYSAKLIEVMETKSKPEGVSDADWEKRKKTITGLGHWMTGLTYSGQNKFGPADQALRAALPFIEDNDQLKAPALFYLGLANYKMEKILDAIKFNEECAKIKSPFQARAQQNLRAIRSQYRVVR